MNANSAPHNPARDLIAEVTGTMRAVIPVVAVIVTRGRHPLFDRTVAAVLGQSRQPDQVLVVDVDADPSVDLHVVTQAADAPGLFAPDALAAGSLVAGPLAAGPAGPAPRALASVASSSLGTTQPGAVTVIPAGKAKTFGQAVDQALDHVPAQAWLWLLHDDCVPEHDALSQLLRAVEHHQGIAVAGCKQRRLKQETQRPVGWLLEVGHTVSPLGRRITGIDDTEIDQGQHDAKEDVLAVGLAGALVRSAVWRQVGGTDPEYGPFGDSTDICRRIHRAGHRVIVVPQAVVNHAQRSLHEGGSTYRRRRRSEIHHRLVHAPAYLVALAYVAVVLWAPVAALIRLGMKQPGKALAELAVAAITAVRIRPLVRARSQVARAAQLPRRTLRPLLASWSQVYQVRRESHLARVQARRARTAPTDLERTELRLLARRRHLALSMAMLVAVAASLVLFGPWLGSLATPGARLSGGALLPAPLTAQELWQAATAQGPHIASSFLASDVWGIFPGGGLPADPVLMVLAGLAFVAAALGASVQLLVHVLVLAAIPLATLGAWCAAGALARSPWSRLAAAVVWGLSPVMLTALTTGRLDLLLMLMALPWVVLGWMRMLGADLVDQIDLPGWRPPRRQASLTAACATGLALAVATAASPLLLPVAIVAAVLASLTARRGRGYPWLALLPSVVVAAPFWTALARGWHLGSWRMLLIPHGVALPFSPQPVSPLYGPVFAGALTGGAASAGSAVAGSATAGYGLSGMGHSVTAWRMLLGMPDAAAAGPWFAAQPPGQATTGAATALAWLAVLGPMLLGAAIVVTALWAAVSRHRQLDPQGHASASLLASRMGILAAAGALAAATALAGRGIWPGTAVAIATAGLGVAALTAGIPQGLRRFARSSRWVTSVLVAAIAILPLVHFASWTVSGRGQAMGQAMAQTVVGQAGEALPVEAGPVEAGGVALDSDMGSDSSVTIMQVRGHAVPAVGRQQLALGHLVLSLSVDSGVVSYSLLRYDGTALTETSVAGEFFSLLLAQDARNQEAVNQEAWNQAQGSEAQGSQTQGSEGQTPVVQGQAAPDHAAQDQEVAAPVSPVGLLVAELTAGQAPDLAVRLGALGVAAVQVPQGASADLVTTPNMAGTVDLVTTLDMVAGLSRATEQGTLVWRVDAPINPDTGAASATASPASSTARSMWLLVTGAVLGITALFAIPTHRRGR